jgi:pyruvate formate lyase activating enzyme
MKKASLFHKAKDHYLRCGACRHNCVIAPGQSGVCGVRQNKGGELYLRVYGHAVAVNVDPIEKKPLYHFMPGSEVFSFGTIGCNFQCTFCQNWEISQADVEKSDRGQDLQPKTIVERCRKENIPIIAYTYNEPTIFVEYAHDTAKLAQKHGIKNVFVSNGYESEECLRYMADWCDAINIDIKAYDQKFYTERCGGAKVQGVLDSVKLAHDLGIWVECTTLIIPDLNDSDRELRKIAEFIESVSPDIPWHVTAFHPDYKMMDRGRTPAKTLNRAWRIGRDAGLHYVYTGNLSERGHDNTECYNCGELLVERFGMECLSCDVDDGSCPKCKKIIPGVWKM